MNAPDIRQIYKDPSRWFEELGTCRCGKPATGWVRGDRNQNMGAYCKRCGEARIKSAEKERGRVRHDGTKIDNGEQKHD